MYNHLAVLEGSERIARRLATKLYSSKHQGTKRKRVHKKRSPKTFGKRK